MGNWTGFSAKTLKGMIRTIDNKIAYRNERIEKDQREVAIMEGQREELAEALAAAEAGGDE